MEVLPKRSRWVWRKDNLFTGSCFLLFGSVRRGYSLTALISLEMQGFLHWQMIDFEGFFYLTWTSDSSVSLADSYTSSAQSWSAGSQTHPGSQIPGEIFIHHPARVEQRKKQRWHKVANPNRSRIALESTLYFPKISKGCFFFLFIKTTIFLLFRVFSVLRNWMHSLSPLQPLAMWLGRKPDGINCIKSEFLDPPWKGRFDIEIKDSKI